MDQSDPIPWLTLRAVPGIGPVTAWRLIEAVGGNIHHLFALCDSQLLAMGLNASQCLALTHPPDLSPLLAWAAQPDQHLITPDHPAYPPALAAIGAAPLVLWCRGNPAALAIRQIAMVGSRQPTHSGLENARRLATELVGEGLAITSGLALGIDGACHGAALDAGGLTLAVLGSGLDKVYPKRHQRLADRILAGGGALLCELEPTAAPLAEQFPRRNRIISGLTLGTLVVEAAQKSGSLITARYALEQGREVFAVPGAAQNSQAAGCNRLIQQGAKLVLTGADVVEELGWCRQRPVASPPAASQRLPSGSLLDNVGYEATSVDVIAARARLPVEVVIGQLVELELEGAVAAVAGGYVRRGG